MNKLQKFATMLLAFLGINFLSMDIQNTGNMLSNISENDSIILQDNHSLHADRSFIFSDTSTQHDRSDFYHTSHYSHSSHYSHYSSHY